MNPDIFDFQEISNWIVESVVWRVKQKTSVASYEMCLKEWLTRGDLEEDVEKSLRFQLVPGWENWEWELLITKEEFISLLEKVFWEIDN